MRKHIRSVCCIILILVLVVVSVNCSILKRFEPPDKSKTEKPPTETPVKTPTPKPNVQAIIQEGIAYRKAGKLKKAIAAFRQALKLEPKNTEAANQLQETQNELNALIDLHLKQGIKYFTQENLQDAISEWNIVLELDPSNKEAADYKERAQRKLDALKDQQGS